MAYPPLIKLESEADYKTHFEESYCKTPIITFDAIAVRFRKQNFSHCFFESVATKDDTFSAKRAERVDWIKAALQDTNSERYAGWDSKKKRYDATRRVTLVMGDYVVVIAMTSLQTADFVTAFIADTPATSRRPMTTVDKIRRGPRI